MAQHLERSRFCPHYLCLCPSPTSRHLWVISVLYIDHKIAGLIPASAATFSPFLSKRPFHWNTPPNTGMKRLLSGRVGSVAKLPVMVSTVDSVEVRASNPWLNAMGSLAKSRRSLESNQMGNTSPSTEPLTSELTYPVSLWRSTRQEVAPGNTSYRRPEKLR